jgi:hypothetical protein
VVFPLSQMNILRDEGRALYVFFENHFVYLLAHLHTFLDLLQLAAPPRGPYHL